MTLSELRELIEVTAAAVDDDLEQIEKWAREWAVSDNAYRLARATAFLQSTGSVAARNATADLATGDERERARLAEGMQQASIEAVRAHRAELSAYQTLANAHRAEAEFSRTVPDPFRESEGVRRFEAR